MRPARRRSRRAARHSGQPVGLLFLTFRQKDHVKALLAASARGELWAKAPADAAARLASVRLGPAPNPMDIRWESLAAPRSLRRKRKLQHLGMTLVLIPLSAAGFAYATFYQASLRMTNPRTAPIRTHALHLRHLHQVSRKAYPFFLDCGPGGMGSPFEPCTAGGFFTNVGRWLWSTCLMIFSVQAMRTAPTPQPKPRPPTPPLRRAGDAPAAALVGAGRRALLLRHGARDGPQLDRHVLPAGAAAG